MFHTFTIIFKQLVVHIPPTLHPHLHPHPQTPHGDKDFYNVIATLDPEAPRRCAASQT